MSGAMLVSVQVGQVAPLGPQDVASGFVKRAVAGPVRVAALGLEGDAQADRRVHGGPEKAVYGYGEPAYAQWAAAFPEHGPRLRPGAFGENLTMAGWSEADVCIGDVVAVGTARLWVTQPREPCFKLALHFEDSRMPVAMRRMGLCGWYYGVRAPGVIAAGDTAELVERPNPAWPVGRLFGMLGRRSGVAEEMRELLDMQGLAGRWRRIARERLRQGELL